MLESYCHDGSSFVTLTYNDEHLPRGEHLEPRAMQLFLKRLREKIAPHRFRFFGCGEYSHAADRQFNPHYHLNLFGLHWLGRYGDAVLSDHIQAAWGKGFITCAEFNRERAAYVAGYVVKKWTRRNDDVLEGHEPEFARMSLRPGIGAFAVATLAKAIGGQLPSVAVSMLNGASVKTLGRTMLLGRYLSRKLREQFPEYSAELEALKDVASHERSAALLNLLAAKIDASPRSATSLKSVYSEEVAQKILQIEKKAERQFNQQRKL